MDSNKKYGGVLKNCTPPMIGLVMYGNLYDDPNARFPDGADVRTSAVVSVDEKNHKVETLNTIYTYEPLEKYYDNSTQ